MAFMDILAAKKVTRTPGSILGDGVKLVGNEPRS